MPAARNVHEYRKTVLSEKGPASPLARLVAIAVVQGVDGKTLESWESAETIARNSGLAERSVRKYLSELTREGWLAEFTKKRGRDYWLKIRTLQIPVGLPAQDAGSNPAQNAGSGLPARQAPLPANGASLPAADVATACKPASKDPAQLADALEQNSSSALGRVRPAIPAGPRPRPGEIVETEEIQRKRREAAALVERTRRST